VKYAALLLNTLALGLLAWALAGVTSVVGGRSAPSRMPMVEVKPLPDKDVQEQASIMTALQAINSLRTRGDQTSSYSTAGLIAQPAPGAPGTDGPLLPERKVTMVMHSADGAVAVVDGHLVRSGQRLGDGGRIGAIREDRLVVAEKNGRQTMKLPVDGLRVGTLRATNAQVPVLAEQVISPRAAAAVAAGAKP
jgi:hypothetical protein